MDIGIFPINQKDKCVIEKRKELSGKPAAYREEGSPCRDFQMSNTSKSPVVSHAHDLVLLFEAINSNPNGDPDANASPRMVPGTNICQVSSVCMKRKVRIALREMYGQDDPRYAQLYIDTDKSLNAKEDEVAQEFLGLSAMALRGQKARHPEMVKEFIKGMCNRYFDIRAFGAVLTQTLEKLTGPVQYAMAESVSPVELLHLQVTRSAISGEKELLEEGMTTMFGCKSVIRYGLFRAHIYVTPAHARETGFTEEDLDRLIQGIIHMFDNDKSDIRPSMQVRCLFDFEHLDGDQTLRHQTVECVEVTPVEDVANGSRFAQSLSDYSIKVNTADIPSTIKFTQLL